mgnify:CR=1 FL=1
MGLFSYLTTNVVNSCLFNKRAMLFVLFTSSQVSVAAENKLTLQHAIDLAISSDLWHVSANLKQQSLLKRSEVANSFANPKVSLEMANLPTDTWQFDQEAMSQIKLGVSQQIPRGDVLKIKQHSLALQANKYPVLGRLRNAKVSLTVSELWLDAFTAQSKIALITKDMSLFEQMVDITKANYASVVGNTRQQDVIRAQLELVQLEDKLNQQQQRYRLALDKLQQWLNHSIQPAIAPVEQERLIQTLSQKLSHYTGNPLATKPGVYQMLQSHPELQVFDIEQQVSKLEVEKQEQSFKPKWSVKASYGYRQDDPLNQSRADLFSVGVSVDVPLFSNDQINNEVAAAKASASAIKTDRALTMRGLYAGFTSQLGQYQLLLKRRALFEDGLLNQVHEQAEAALTAYTNDDGSFAEVVSARMTELNTKLNAVSIHNELAKSLVRLNYYLPATSNSVKGHTYVQ